MVNKLKKRMFNISVIQELIFNTKVSFFIFD